MMQYSIQPKKIMFFLLCGWVGLWSASAVQDITIFMTGTSEKIWILDVDYEEGLYSWFSVLLLSFAALLAFFLTSYKAERGRNVQKHWRVIGIIFLLLSMDEMLSFHERVSGMLSGAFSTSGIFEFAWVIPALFAVAVVGFMFWPFMRQISSQVARTIVIAGALFVFGAVGMEMVAGLFISESSAKDEAFTSPIYRLLTNAEEGFEGLGVIIFIKALLMQAQLYFPVLFRITEPPVSTPAVGVVAERGCGGFTSRIHAVNRLLKKSAVTTPVPK